jgi:hypothetical protein
MHVFFEADFPATDQQRDLVLRRARAATRRLAWAVSQAKVKLTHALGMPGTAAKHCRVELTIGDTSTVIATASGVDWRAALDGALRRAARALPGIQRRSRERAPP